MIRKATIEDVNEIAKLYDMAIDYEDAHIKYTSWQKGIYPTADTAKLGVKNDSMYVLEGGNKLLAAVIIDNRQPPEYRNISWGVTAKQSAVMVIHTLCVHPECSGLGIGSAIVDFAKELAKKTKCLAIRLNTTSRNTLAIRLYEKNGFSVVAKQKILLNGQIACDEHSFMEFVIR